MSKLSSYFFEGFHYLNYINHALDGHQIHSPYIFNLYLALIKNKGSRFKPRKIHKQLLNIEEINASITSKKISIHYWPCASLGDSIFIICSL
ncbi:MAG: hypothetical protein CBB92_02580 [Flammeovirgaceae bacterium TMED32]|nr:MAG: hypothetical protein CBB92_02580 [Flammeovirgaceae bacterium TMED32]